MLGFHQLPPSIRPHTPPDDERAGGVRLGGLGRKQGASADAPRNGRGANIDRFVHAHLFPDEDEVSEQGCHDHTRKRREQRGRRCDPRDARRSRCHSFLRNCASMPSAERPAVEWTEGGGKRRSRSCQRLGGGAPASMHRRISRCSSGGRPFRGPARHLAL